MIEGGVPKKKPRTIPQTEAQNYEPQKEAESNKRAQDSVQTESGSLQSSVDASKSDGGKAQSTKPSNTKMEVLSNSLAAKRHRTVKQWLRGQR